MGEGKKGTARGGGDSKGRGEEGGGGRREEEGGGEWGEEGERGGRVSQSLTSPKILTREYEGLADRAPLGGFPDRYLHHCNAIYTVLLYACIFSTRHLRTLRAGFSSPAFPSVR